MRVITAGAFLQLIFIISVSGEPLPVGQCLILNNGSIAVNGLIPANGSYVCNATSQSNPTQTSVQLQVILTRQEMRSQNHSASLDISITGQCLILKNGSLAIHGIIIGGAGSYICNTTSQNNSRIQTTVWLQVISGQQNVSTSISPTVVLPNGTLVAYRGLNISFNCSSAAALTSQKLTWGFRGAYSSNDTLVSGSGPWLDFSIEDIQPSAQGEYLCKSQNSLSHITTNRSTQLLVYYAPERHPECLWILGEDPSRVQFNCTWAGAYPTPTLGWGEIHHLLGTQLEGHLYAHEQTDSLVVTMNRSMLFPGQKLKCKVEHPVLSLQEEKSCLFILKPPFPQGEPLVTALENSDVTLTCSEDSSLPAATTTWRRGEEAEDIVSGFKYVVSVFGPELRLTIVNVSKGDEGIYFCRSENPLAIRELEVFLTVKNSSAYTGAFIGIFIAALIVGIGVVVAKLVYSSRDRICLGNGFGRMEEDGGDVISLVESEEDIFHDTVPRLPPLTNGNHTTHVQIHPIPSSDPEDIEIADTSPQQQDYTIGSEDPLQLIKF